MGTGRDVPGPTRLFFSRDERDEIFSRSRPDVLETVGASRISCGLEAQPPTCMSQVGGWCSPVQVVSCGLEAGARGVVLEMVCLEIRLTGRH
jgi:hypothetical protein